MNEEDVVLKLMKSPVREDVTEVLIEGRLNSRDIRTTKILMSMMSLFVSFDSLSSVTISGYDLESDRHAWISPS